MLCPNCQSTDVIVRDSRAVGNERQRRRQCRACNARWFTHEVLVVGTLDVPKREPTWWTQARRLQRAGWSKTQIAKMCGVNQSSVSRALRPTLREANLNLQRERLSGEEGRLVMRVKRAVLRAKSQEARP